MDIGVSQTKAQTGKGTGGFAVGLGIKYQKELGFNDYAKQVYNKGAKALFAEQLGIAHYYLNTRTGGLEQHLASFPFNIKISNGSYELELLYQLKVRFLDLKKSKKGKPKNFYEPIYNREVWGFVYGRIYKQLRYGFSQELRNKYTEKLREIYKQPI
jgi:hypothetical protein